MELYSAEFLLFLVLALTAHETVGRVKTEYQWIVKLAVSAGFYFCMAKYRILFLAISVVTVWLCAKYMDRIAETGRAERKNPELSKDEKKVLKKKTQRRKRVVLYATIALNLLILILVKYIMPVFVSSIVLPLGISFYTFMAISYLADVYGEKYKPEDNILKVALYLSWFPQMLQGPINRFDYVRDTLFAKSLLTYDRFRTCALLFLFGAVKKYSIANILAPSVDEIFLRADLTDIPGSYLLFTAFLFAVQQYADFSGGIDMVMAVSGLFGVKMNENFRQPYFAKSISEFWRRWHISLGGFLRDYVFYPFALLPKMMKLNEKLSSKFGKHVGRSVVAGMGNILVFLLVGLWHGSALHYIAWGLYNGIIIVISDFLSPLFDKTKTHLGIKKDSKIFAAFQIVRTFLIIVLAGYFDAVSDVSNGFVCFKNTFTSFRASEFISSLRYIYDCGLISDFAIVTVIIATAMMLVCSILRENHRDPIDIISGKNIVVRWAVYLLMIYVMLFGFASSGGNGGFMYAVF